MEPPSAGRFHPGQRPSSNYGIDLDLDEIYADHMGGEASYVTGRHTNRPSASQGQPTTAPSASRTSYDSQAPGYDNWYGAEQYHPQQQKPVYDEYQPPPRPVIPASVTRYQLSDGPSPSASFVERSQQQQPQHQHALHGPSPAVPLKSPPPTLASYADREHVASLVAHHGDPPAVAATARGLPRHPVEGHQPMMRMMEDVDSSSSHSSASLPHANAAAHAPTAAFAPPPPRKLPALPPGQHRLSSPINPSGGGAIGSSQYEHAMPTNATPTNSYPSAIEEKRAMATAVQQQSSPAPYDHHVVDSSSSSSSRPSRLPATQAPPPPPPPPPPRDSLASSFQTTNVTTSQVDPRALYGSLSAPAQVAAASSSSQWGYDPAQPPPPQQPATYSQFARDAPPQAPSSFFLGGGPGWAGSPAGSPQPPPASMAGLSGPPAVFPSPESSSNPPAFTSLSLGSGPSPQAPYSSSPSVTSFSMHVRAPSATSPGSVFGGAIFPGSPGSYASGGGAAGAGGGPLRPGVSPHDADVVFGFAGQPRLDRTISASTMASFVPVADHLDGPSRAGSISQPGSASLTGAFPSSPNGFAYSYSGGADKRAGQLLGLQGFAEEGEDEAGPSYQHLLHPQGPNPAPRDGAEHLMGDIAGYEEEDEEAEAHAAAARYFEPALLSNVAVQLRDTVVRGEHVKGSIPFQGAFTGRDVVNAIQALMPDHVRGSDRRAALEVARSLKSQLFIIEVEFDDVPLTDSLDDIFTFLDESEAGGSGFSELPTGVFVPLTRCYMPSCTGNGDCYSPKCPHKEAVENLLTRHHSSVSTYHEQPKQRKRNWVDNVEPEILLSLTPSEVARQEAIHMLILGEEQYHEDLMTIETLFVLPVRAADPPVIHPPVELERFIFDVFGNITELRKANERLSELFQVRQRESGRVIENIGDILLHAVSEYEGLYPEYLSRLSSAETALDTALATFPELRILLEKAAKDPETRGRDLRRFLARPQAQLQRTQKLLSVILKETPVDVLDHEFVREAEGALAMFAMKGKLREFQRGTGRDKHEHWGWQSLVEPEDLERIPKSAQRRQHVLFEIIKGEIEYVTDLRSIDMLFIKPLREAYPPIIGLDRLERFLHEVFGNYREILAIHERLLRRLCERQMNQHPEVSSVTDLIYDALLQWGDAYRDYAANYPIAKWKVDRERQNNPAFKEFFESCTRQPQAYRKDLSDFINRPIPRLLRYSLLLGEMISLLEKDGLPSDEVRSVLEDLKLTSAKTDKAVAAAQERIEMWSLKDTLTTPSDARFSDSVITDLELLNPSRQLIHKGYLRQPDNVQVFVVLLDNYLVTTRHMRVREGKRSASEEGALKHVVFKRPIPLSLITLGNFDGPPIRQSSSSTISSNIIGRSSTRDAAAADKHAEVWPFTYVIKSSDVMGGTYILWADSEAKRAEWRDKLQEAKTLSDVVADSNKVFELGVISKGTLYKSGSAIPTAGSSRPSENAPFAGQITCSVPFRTRDRRELVAIGCDEGVWIGMKGNIFSFSKVLHVRNVLQCAVLEAFSMFLVLADHSLYAYQIEALVPTAGSSVSSRGPERLSGSAHVLFFSVGQLSGRTLVCYMKKKQLDSVFRVLEPMPIDARADHGRRNFFGSGAKSGLSFRVFKDFFIPSDARLIHFLKAKLAIVCAKGFEIMDLANLQGGTIPIFVPSRLRENPALATLAKRCESASPLGMFRSTDTEFLLCYHNMGFYVEKHGEPSRDFRVIEWETQPKTVAFHPPHFLLFSYGFIEIRHIHTGKLVQIITGKDIRCIWDGTSATNSSSTPGPEGYGQESATTEARIHVAMDDDKTPGRAGTPQLVFELEPTVLLDDPFSAPPPRPHPHSQQSSYFPRHQQQPQPQGPPVIPFHRDQPPQLFPAGLEFTRGQQHYR